MATSVVLERPKFFLYFLDGLVVVVVVVVRAAGQETSSESELLLHAASGGVASGPSLEPDYNP